MLGPLSHLHVYPIVAAVLFPTTWLLTYGLSVLLGHTEADWPYISDTTTYAPESCIYAQLMNGGAVLVGIIVYIRYKQVDEFYASHLISRFARNVNLWALFIGWLGAFGISLAANFQETAVFTVHYIGSILAFGFGTVYLWAQVYASHMLCNITHGNCLFYVRVTLTVISTVSFLITIICEKLAWNSFHGSDPTKWHPEDGGFSLHVASTTSEWIVAASFIAMLLSFVREFKQVMLDSPKITLRINRDSLLMDDGNSVLHASYAEAYTDITDNNVAIAT